MSIALNTMGEVMAVVAIEMNVPVEAMTSQARLKPWALARHMAMRVAQVRTGYSIAGIGRALGGRDNKTVLHGITIIGQRIAVEPLLESALERINEMLDAIAAEKGIDVRSVAARLADVSIENRKQKVRQALERVREPEPMRAAVLAGEIESDRQAVAKRAALEAEAKSLRKKGWSIGGLARRFRLLEDEIAAIIGEPWKVRA